MSDLMPVEAPVVYGRSADEAQAEYADTFKASVRNSRLPNAESVPDQYLSALSQFFSESYSAYGISETLKGQIEKDSKLDTRLSLESAINYLGVRYLSGKLSTEEEVSLNNLRVFTQTGDPLDAVEVGKEKVRAAYQQDEIEVIMPDSGEVVTSRDHLTVRQTANIAQLILDDDQHKDKRGYSSVHNICFKLRSLANIGNNADSGFKREMFEDPNIRRDALDLLIKNFSDQSITDDFIDKHDPEVQSILIYLEDNRGLIAREYLRAVEAGKPQIIENGELSEKIKKLLGEDNPERDFLEKHAGSIEGRLRSFFVRLLDPKTGKLRDTVVEYEKSEKALTDAINKSEDAEAAIWSDEENTDERLPNFDRSGYTASEDEKLQLSVLTDEKTAKKDIIVEDAFPGITSAIDLAIAKHLAKPQAAYKHLQVQGRWGIGRSDMIYLLDHEYVRPLYAGKGNHHPIFKPEEGIALYIFKKFNRQVKSWSEVNAINDFISKRLTEAQLIKQS